MHLKRIFKEGELVEEVTCKDFLQVRLEGRREVERKRKHYNLDAIISVGYRVNSTSATRFRQWATRVLREHLTQGYTIQQHRFEQNARELGDDKLRELARHVTEQLRKSTTVDWQVRDSVRAKLRNLVRRALRKWKYPPDGQQEAIDLVLKQAEALSQHWSA